MVIPGQVLSSPSFSWWYPVCVPAPAPPLPRDPRVFGPAACPFGSWLEWPLPLCRLPFVLAASGVLGVVERAIRGLPLPPEAACLPAFSPSRLRLTLASRLLLSPSLRT